MRCSVLLALALSGCGLSLSDYDKIVRESQGCALGEACALAGSSQCTCPRPVNAKHQRKVQDAADDVRCGDMVVECRECSQPLCAGGACQCGNLGP